MAVVCWSPSPANPKCQENGADAVAFSEDLSATKPSGDGSIEALAIAELTGVNSE